jgi:acyl dehydratase
MSSIFIKDNAALADWIDKDIPPSEWVTVTPEMADHFAAATGDREWTNEGARPGSGNPSAAASGFLVLSLVSALRADTVRMPPPRMGLNYGLNNVRFIESIPVGARMRATFRLVEVKPLEGQGAQLVWRISVYREGSEDPVLLADNISRRFE